MEQPRVSLSRTSAMRALIVDPKLTYQSDYPSPTLTPGESVIRVSLAGICGTDLEITRGYMAFRGVPGHEFVGCVVETTDPRLSGKRVVGEINVACAGCSFCRIGLGRHCPDRTVLGIVGRDGAFAEYLTLPNENLLIVPDSISDETAVFTEPLAAAYEIFEELHIARNQSVVVLGDGRLGAIVALALRAEGYRPTVAGHHREKLERLASLEVSTMMEQDLKEKVDYVIDCTGRGDGLQRAIELVKPRATIVLKSTAVAGAALNLAPVVINEITVVGSRCGRFGPALAALESGAVDPRPLLDGIYSLEEGFIAMEAAGRPSSIKILLKP
jgi:threonine dehydrogenase-like Zn-dependent dehydrogenase